MRGEALRYGFLTPPGRITSAAVRLASRFEDGEIVLSDTGHEQKALPKEPLHFVLGRDHGGHWIVQETHGLCGGLFTSKEAAIRYAKFESAEGGDEIQIAPETFELKFSS
jgi:hypothetical protein